MNTLEEVKKIKIGLNEIEAVVRNQEPVSSKLLDAYEGKPDQFDLLVKIIAEGQGVDPNAEGFRLFIFTWKEGWAEWALTAKDFRIWLESTQYTYENTGPQRLCELYLEWVNLGGPE